MPPKGEKKRKDDFSPEVPAECAHALWALTFTPSSHHTPSPFLCRQLLQRRLKCCQVCCCLTGGLLSRAVRLKTASGGVPAFHLAKFQPNAFSRVS